MVLTHRQIRLPYNASKFLESFNNMAEITLCKTGDQVPAQDFDILGPHRCIALDVRAHLKAHTCNKELFHSGHLTWRIPGHASGKIVSNPRAAHQSGRHSQDCTSLQLLYCKCVAVDAEELTTPFKNFVLRKSAESP